MTRPKNLTTASTALLNMVKSGLRDEIANAEGSKKRTLEGQLEMVLEEIRARHRRGDHG